MSIAGSSNALSGAPRRPAGRWWLHSAGMLAGSCVISLAACEIATRAIYARPPNPGKEPQIRYMADTDLGYVHVPNQQGWIDEGWVTINALGFRGSLPVSPKPDDVFRVMVIGDSVALGWGVNDHETFPVHLESLFWHATGNRRVEVLNCAVSGYNTDQESRLLAKYGPLLEPDLVIVAFYWNDLPRPNTGGQSGDVASATAVRALAPGETFRLGVDPSRLNRLLRRSRALYATKSLLLAAKNALGGGDVHVSLETDLLEGRQSSAIEASWNAVRAAFGRIKDVATAGGYAVAVVILPSRQQVITDYPHARYQTHVKRAVDGLGFLVIDPLPEFVARRAEVEDLFIPYDRDHPAAAGHLLIAKTIVAGLRHNEQLWHPVAGPGADMSRPIGSADRATTGVSARPNVSTRFRRQMSQIRQR